MVDAGEDNKGKKKKKKKKGEGPKGVDMGALLAGMDNEEEQPAAAAVTAAAAVPAAPAQVNVLCWGDVLQFVKDQLVLGMA